MIGRLAELLVRVNPAVRRALTLTYSHLFLDEFQDTTHIQYALVCMLVIPSGRLTGAASPIARQHPAESNCFG